MAWVAVFDTDILISALLSQTGSPFRCLVLAKTGLVQSVTCEEILGEFSEKLQTKFGLAPGQAEAAAHEVRSISRVVTLPHALRAVAADPADDKELECALVGGAGFVVTGDRRHLLPLRAFRGVVIASAPEFLQAVVASSSSG